MTERKTDPGGVAPPLTQELGAGERDRRRFITQILGGSLMLVTLPTLASTLFKKGASEAEIQRVKQEYLQKYSPPDYDPFAHRWAYGIDAYKCIGCNQCMTACKLENAKRRHPGCRG